ncbi:hypothetical protein T439DRAFT_382712 [Meredithblackwellia eburnea MCA 4105]
MDDLETVSIPLTYFDSGAAGTGLTFAFILATTTPFDPSQVDSAISRAAKKWRLLAGRLEQDKKSKSWSIRVPTASQLPEGYKTHNFSTSTFVQDDPLEIFTDNSDHLSKNSPFLSVHCALATDRVHIGISIPHGVFDGSGLGLCWKAISAELKGMEWEVPVLQKENPLAAAVKQSGYIGGEKTSAGFASPWRDWEAPTFWSMARLIVSLGKEYLWHKAENGEIRLGKDVVEFIAERIKQEVVDASDGKEWVSTGDALFAWLLKTAYTNEETSGSKVSSTMLSPPDFASQENTTDSRYERRMYSIRGLFPTIDGFSDNTLEQYPHNGFLPSPVAEFKASELHAMSYGQLAVAHRQAIVSSRNVSQAVDYSTWVESIGGSAVPVRRGGQDSWLFSNHCQADLAEGIEWGQGTRLEGHWIFAFPVTPDHAVTINKVRDGIILMSAMRKSRWRSVRVELERIKVEMAAK